MKKLRSQEWYGRQDRDGFVYRSWMKSEGYPHDLFDGRPIIGICNTWSELTPCNSHFRDIAEWVKRGVYEAGGFPLEFPVMSLGETQLRPTAMLFRNLASMDVEESIRGNPMDGVVLLMGCDKTTPSLLMGAASCDLPTIGLSGGPMLSGKFQGHDLGSGTGVWQMDAKVRAGEMRREEMFEAESCMHRSKGHCMTMGTASTMASMVESLGMALPGNAAIPAVDARRYTLAQMTGRRIVEMVREDVRMSQILTREAFENSIRANAAIGGSTNAVIHSIALAGRVGVKINLDDWERLGSGLPCLVNIQPSGKYLMEDFFYAGGVPVVLRELGEAGVLNRDALTVNGRSMWENVREAPCWNRDVIRTFAEPFKATCGNRGAARQPGAGRRGDQAVRREPAPSAASRTRGGVRDDRRFSRAYRRRSAGYRRKLRDGAEELRAERLSGDGGGGQHAAAAESIAQGRARYGSHFRRAHERHRVWHGDSARVPGSRGGRAARAGANRRHDHARRAEALGAARRG